MYSLPTFFLPLQTWAPPALLLAACLVSCTTRPSREVETVRTREGIHFDVTERAKLSDGDRSDWGGTQLPVWSPLTPFEIRVLQSGDLIRSGDPDALLALFVFASGNVRDETGFAPIQSRIQAFADSLAPLMAKEKTTEAKGERLFRAMHEAFFPPKSSPGDIAGYDVEESRLTAVFRERRYNCVSSSLLYIALARRFDLRVQGVMMPTHVFVQVQGARGRVIEVETTALLGFGIAHDSAFFARSASGWGALRGLGSITPDDYRSRRILEPWELGVYNMSNQHAAPGRMTYADYLRLTEARGYLAPGDAAAQHSRLNAYAAESNTLSARGDFPSIRRMYDVAAGPAVRNSIRFAGDTAFIRLRAWSAFHHARALSETGERDSACDLAAKTWMQLDPRIGDIESLELNLSILIQTWLQAAVDAKRYDEAERLVERLGPRCLKAGPCAAMIPWIYSQRAHVHWQASRWSSAITDFERSIEAGIEEGQKPVVLRNIEGAYRNWALEKVNGGKDAEAEEILDRCLSRYPDSKGCREAKQRLKAARPSPTKGSR